MAATVLLATVVVPKYFSPASSCHRKTTLSSSEAGGGLKAASKTTVSAWRHYSATSLSTTKQIKRIRNPREKKIQSIRNSKRITNQQQQQQQHQHKQTFYNSDEHENDNNNNNQQLLNLKEYVEQTKELISSSSSTGTVNGCGPPRWFSPLECRNQWKDSPLLFYLPGLDGVGLGLISQHQALGKVFDVWCLHIPVMDRTPFKDLVKFVDKTVKEENCRSPNRPIYLVGESIGGCLALAVAARSPTIDLMLILANPAKSYGKSQLRNLVPFLEAIPEQLHNGFPYILATFTDDPIRMAMAGGQRELPLTQNIQQLSENLSALLSSISVRADSLPRESLIWKLKMLESASSLANSCIHAVKAQSLILASGRDQFLPSLEEAERLSDLLPSSQKRIFKDSAHALFMNAAFDLVTVIKGAYFYRRGRNFDSVADFIPPTSFGIKRLSESYWWLDIAASPVMLSTLENGTIVRGLAGIPSEGPVVLVGYHMLLALDVSPILTSFLNERNIMVRGIAHPLFFQKELEQRLPDSSTFDPFRIMGAVPVSASNFYRILATKSHVLLYPGGVREAFHRKGEENKLFWPSQSEFVRVAARFGAKIIPFGVAGTDDLMDVVLDYDDQMKIPYLNAQLDDLNESITKLRTDAEGEIAKQVVYFPAVLPKLPGRFYYLFGKPIETEGRKNELRDKEKADELYLQVKSEVERSMDYLQEKREKDLWYKTPPKHQRLGD